MSKLYEHVYTGIKVEIADDQMLTHPFRLISSDNKTEKSVKTQENIKNDESEKIKEPKVIGSSKNEWTKYALSKGLTKKDIKDLKIKEIKELIKITEK